MNECLTTPQHKKQIGYWVSLEVNMYLRNVNLKHWSALHWRFLKGKKSVSVSRSSNFRQALEQCPKWPNDSKSIKYIVRAIYKWTTTRLMQLDVLIKSAILRTKVTCPLAFVYNSFNAAVTRRKEMFYLTTHSTHFIYGYMASDIW